MSYKRIERPKNRAPTTHTKGLRTALTLSRAEVPGLLLLSPLPHHMWFGEKAAHSWFWFSCLSKEAEYPCTFIDAVDSQLDRFTPDLKGLSGL